MGLFLFTAAFLALRSACRRAARRGRAWLPATLALAFVAALPAAHAQLNLPRVDTSLPGARPAPAPPPPFARQSPLPAPDTRLPGGDQRECGPTPHHALCARGRWTLFSAMDVRASAPDFTGSYRIEIAKNDEARATYRETIAGKTRSGEVILIGTSGVAYRASEKFGDDVSVVDATITTPLLTAQLAALLLDQAVIGPPAEVTGPVQLAANSDARYLRISTPATAALFGPPWRVTGTARPGKTPGDVSFSLRLAYRPVDARGVLVEGRTDTLKLDGTASFAPRPPTLPDRIGLKGFTVLDDDKPIAAQPTVGDARKAIAR